MSFSKAFDRRRKEVIEPGIIDAGMKPVFADTREISDSIITEIVNGIAGARVIFGDVTLEPRRLFDRTRFRNANVLYEIGIAHAARQAEEVVLFRSDDGPLLFDITNIRVNHYDPDNDPVAAKELVTKAIRSAIDEVDLTRSAVVSDLVQRLDESATIFLCDAATKGAQPEPPHVIALDAVSFGPRRAGMLRLLDFGCISTLSTAVTKDGPFLYAITPLGRAVFERMKKMRNEGVASEGVESAST